MASGTTSTTGAAAIPLELVPMDVAARIPRVIEALGTDLGPGPVDRLVVSQLTNIRYLTGFTGSAGTLVLGGPTATLVTDGRYATQAPRQVADAGVDVEVVIAGTDADKVLAGLVHGAARVGLEADSVTWSTQRRFAAAWPGAELVPTAGVVEGFRVIKDAGEIDRIATAARIADAALAEVRPMLSDGPTEAEFALALDTAIRRLGAAGNSFETIVASGPNGALPHARPSHRVISDGDLVVLDFGALVDGYCSDMSRTVAVGEISPRQQAMYEAVHEAQQAGLDAVRAGVAASAVDAACRNSLERHQFAEYFTHSTGHGVGLDIHEAPRVSAVSDATLLSGFVVTVEPGVYVSPHGGVRIEDTVVVTADGCTLLTGTTKSLVPG